MLKNLLTVALRNLHRQKFFAILNLLGLAFGFAACLMIWLYTNDELSYDKFHDKADRIYRINQTFIWGDDDALFGSTGPAVAQAIRTEVPEFETITRVHTPGDFLVTSEANGNVVVFDQSNILAADSNFLDVFTFPLMAGNPKTVLQNPQSLILTASTAEKYFGTTSVLGKQLQFGEPGKQKTYEVTGITHDLPKNSHIQFDMVMSMSSLPRVKRSSDSWMWTMFVTFGVLRPDADPVLVADKVAAVPGKYLEAFLQKYRGISYQEFKESGEEWDLYIQPFLDIHLRSTNVYSRLNEPGDIQTIYILYLAAALILILSLINFVNLSTARATTRAKEVGIRKVIGSDKKLLVFQFLVEATVFVLGSALLALFICELILPYFNNITEKSLSIRQLVAPLEMSTFIFTVLFIGLLSGLYPAFYLSSFRPAQALKGKAVQGLKSGQIRNILVTTQFAISIAILACTLIVEDQVSYWKNLDLGFDQDNKIIVQNTQRLGRSIEAFKNNLLQNPEIKAITASSDTPPIVFDFDNFKLKGTEAKDLAVNYITADESFLDIYGLKLLHGRGLSKAFTDSTNVVVNQYLTKAFGFTQPSDAINAHLKYGGREFRIIGIVEDFNTSLNSQQYPFAIFDEDAPIFRDPSTELTINMSEALNAAQTELLLSKVQALWNSYQPRAPFEYTFAAQDYLHLFQNTIQFSKILRGTAALAIVIACLGLIGLVAFVIERRNKEIGIRKVLGATAMNIWMLLSESFGKLMIIGFVIATPVSWYLMNKWLENFELRTSVSLITILGSGLLMLSIAVLTMSFQTIRASQINPVDYLKEE